MCAASPQAIDAISPPEGVAWTPIADLAPAAAALRASKQWSLDDPVRRFDAQDWWYRLEFDAAPVQPGERLVLGFDGLATVAKVWLNGEELLDSSNMFVAHACDVTHRLKITGNTLVMRFSALDTQLTVKRKRPRWRAPMIENQQLRWFRTTVLGRTPGWSPPAAIVGPWKDIWLERRSSFEVCNVALTPVVQGASGLLDCKLKLVALGGAAIEQVDLQLQGHGQTVSQALVVENSQCVGVLRVPDVALWWPHTHGEPALYHASLRIRIADTTDSVKVDLGHVGFRTISLDSSDGNFSLSVNGVRVFCRGACWTPLDPVTLRSGASDCMHAVEQVRAAGMNMLRVAGTMVYEEAHFFDACDTQGILVWQDLMFANMDYPGDDADFMKSVVTEVQQQLDCIRSRACLAVLCGNSEVAQQASMWGAPREQWAHSTLDHALAQMCAEHAASVAYWCSSAYGGAFPHQGDVGTTSYYGIGAYMRGFDDARRSNLKFATECLAFANIPAETAVARMPGGMATRVHHPGWKARSPRDLGAGWDFDDVRDHYVAAVFGVDPNKLRYANHDRYLTLGRMATGEAMAAAYTEWRRPASSCNGALVLFLQDLWAGAGWGVLDDAGAPKACYHYLTRVLQPVTVLLTDEGGNGLFAHLINETGRSVDAELEISAWRAGDVLVATNKKVLQLPARSAQSLSCLQWFEHFMDLTYAYRFGPKPCDAVVATLRDGRGNPIAQTFYFPEGLDIRQEPDVGLDAQVTKVHEETVEIKVSCKRLALGLHFDVPGFEPEDEYFHLAPGSEMHVLLRRVSQQQLPVGSVHAANSLASSRLKAMDSG